MQARDNKQPDNIVARILIVEDDAQLHALYRYKLEEEGFQVFEASSGQDAITVYRKVKPTLILMDAVMPDMDGFETCEQILKEAGDIKPIILMATALDDDKSVVKAFSAGASDYVTKPIQWAVLTNRIRHLLQASSAQHFKKKCELQQYHANKMATIHRMVGGIAHDFNNLLTGVIGYSELAQELAPQSDINFKTYLTEITKAGMKAKTLIQKLLTFSQDNPATLSPTEPRSIVDEALNMVREGFPSTLTVIEDIEEDLPQVLMDPVHIYQSIVNLCLNARDAMNGHGIITVGVHKVHITEQSCASCLMDFSGDFLEISIGDTGKGVAKNIIPQIFDPFFTTNDMATGLGLSVVHGIVHEHRGHILVDSQKKTGTTFRLYLPIS